MKKNKIRSMQEKFLDALAETADNNGLELTVNYHAANVGYAVVVHPDTFRTLVQIHFDFQSDYAVFQYGQGTPVTGGYRRHANYTQAEKLGLLIQEIVTTANLVNRKPVIAAELMRR